METKSMTEIMKSVVDSRFSNNNNFIMKMIKPRFVSYDEEKTALTVKYKAEEWTMNTGGIMHGGIICTCFDNSFGMISHGLSGQVVTTIDINVRYLEPILEGQEIFITAKADRKGRTIISLSGEAIVNGKTAATASAAFMVLGGGKK